MGNNDLIKHPSDQVFYKVLAFFMGVLALNSQYWQGFDLPKHVVYVYHRKSMFVIVPVAVLLQYLYVVVHYSELQFETLSIIFTIILIASIVLLKLSIAQTEGYKTAMKDFMTKIHLYNYYVIDQKDYVQKALLAAEKFLRWSCFYYMGFCYVCYVSFEAVPIIHNLQKIESYNNITFRLEIIVHMLLPFDYEFNFTNWVITQVIMVYVGFVAITYIFLFDTVNMTFIYHIIGHITIFKHHILTKFNNNMSMTQEEIKDSLIEISQYHIFIKQILNKAEAAFGLNVASIYIHNLISGGLFIYQIMTSGNDVGTILTYGLLIPIYMGILIIISLALENIRITADAIPDLIYGINWENMSVSNQKLVLMLLVQVQPALEFQAAFNIKTGMEPALKIIKTTFSFYVMIKSSI